MRKHIITILGLLLFSLSSRHAGDSPGTGDICPIPSSVPFEARLHALEVENGCLDDAVQGADGTSWPPGWATARIAGGDIPPTRLVADPYPTLHSVVIDAERNR